MQRPRFDTPLRSTNLDHSARQISTAGTRTDRIVAAEPVEGDEYSTTDNDAHCFFHDDVGELFLETSDAVIS